MARVHRHGAGRAQVDVAQAQHHVAGLEDDVLDLLGAVQAVDAADEFHIVGQPGRVRTDGLLVALHRVQGGAVLKRQRQVQHPGAHFHVVHGADRFFPLQQRLHQAGLIQQARVIVHLQAAHTGGQFQDAGHRLVLEIFHQRVHAQAQRQIQNVVAVLDENVFVAGLAIGDARHMAVGVELGDHGRGGERCIAGVVDR